MISIHTDTHVLHLTAFPERRFAIIETRASARLVPDSIAILRAHELRELARSCIAVADALAPLPAATFTASDSSDE